MVISWENLFKLRIANPDKSMLKHEIIKLIVLIKLLRKYKSIKSYIHIYTEFVITNKSNKTRKCDLYFENIKTKEIYFYEIQKNLSDNWVNETKEFYKDFESEFFRSSDLIIIPIKDLSDDINKLNEELDQYVL